MDTLSPDPWQALSPYLDQALSMTGYQRATGCPPSASEQL